MIIRSMWQDLIDKQVKEVIGDGDISHLPGAGQPLADRDDRHTPQELRLAYKIMKDNDITPVWIMVGQEIDSNRESIQQRLRRYARDYQKRYADALRTGSAVQLRNAEARRDSACDRIRSDIDKLNRKILDYNLTLPPQLPHKTALNADDLIKRAFA